MVALPNLIIPPHCNDEGLSLGAIEYLRIKHNLPKFKLDNFPYCQSDISPENEADDHTIMKTVEMLKEGKIVGWYQGNGEIGPRALGHRSLLINPMIKNAKDIINKHGDQLDKDDILFKEVPEKNIFKQIKSTLNDLGIKFDVFSNEKTFYENGDIDKLSRSTLDGLSLSAGGSVLEDDSLVVELNTKKRYINKDELPGAYIAISCIYD